MLAPLEAEWQQAWGEWVAKRGDGWRGWTAKSAAALVPLPVNARLPSVTAEALAVPRTLESRAERIRRETRGDVRAPPPTISPEEVAKLPFAERQKLLQSALPGRAPAPPGWDAADVGGVPWHMQPKFLEPSAHKARHAAELAMRSVLAERKNFVERHAAAEAGGAFAGRVVTAAVNRRVFCKPPKGAERRGLYQMDGRILDDESKRAMPPPDFCKADAAQAKKPFKHIMLEEQPETSLEELVLLHGSTDAGDCARQSQADPHCNICGGGESETGNEILLCDGLRCANNYHQQCCDPVVTEVPEGAWLCPTCVANKNVVDPQVLEDERKAKEALGGTEETVVLCNDGTGVQDIGLLTELLEVIDNSLPLIGKTNAAKLVFAPDHESILITRSAEGGARRVLGGVVIKPHRARGFLEIAFCTVRKEEQRNGVGTRLLSELKEHALKMGVLHLLTYADDSVRL